jgi:hypothetical protein
LAEFVPQEGTHACPPAKNVNAADDINPLQAC